MCTNREKTYIHTQKLETLFFMQSWEGSDQNLTRAQDEHSILGSLFIQHLGIYVSYQLERKILMKAKERKPVITNLHWIHHNTDCCFLL